MSTPTALAVLILTLSLAAAHTTTATTSSIHQSPYIGQEKRFIKSLSQEDIHQLTTGQGWGFAKAAELNGMPGPLHLLQMKQQISLSKNQEKKLQQLYKDMKAQAIQLGKTFVEQEKSLNLAFANKSITERSLSRQLEAIAKTRKKLRYIHLHSHITATTILTPSQIQQYQQHRGYLSTH